MSSGGEVGIAGREDVLGVITNVILVIWGPRGSAAGHRGVSLPRSATRSSLAPGEHLAHLPFLGPHLLLMLFEIVKKSCVKLCREKCVVLPDM